MSKINPTEGQVLAALGGRPKTAATLLMEFAAQHPDYTEPRNAMYYDGGSAHFGKFASQHRLRVALDNLTALGKLTKLDAWIAQSQWQVHIPNSRAKFYVRTDVNEARAQAKKEANREPAARRRAEKEVLAKYATEVDTLTRQHMEEGQ